MPPVFLFVAGQTFTFVPEEKRLWQTPEADSVARAQIQTA